MAATESFPQALDMHMQEQLPTVDFPETYGELYQALTVLGNGAYSQKRIALMEQPDDTFDRMKQSEQILLRALAEGAPEQDLSEEHRQEMRHLMLLMGVPGAQEGAVTHHLRAGVQWVRQKLGV
ncbi:MAG: hypothetical protein PHS73_03760 [Candidatus Peribacteraceae bacterium]|nr:hypothetical protein [Candidatus Peribacteraceae bacterium]